MSSKVTFVMPQSNRYEVDRACQEIVQCLKEQRWNVHGIEVCHLTYGPNEKPRQCVEYIKGDNFLIRFGSPAENQNPECSYHDLTEVVQISLPKIGLRLMPNNRIELYLYLGQNWNKDRQSFFSVTNEALEQIDNMNFPIARYVSEDPPKCPDGSTVGLPIELKLSSPNSCCEASLAPFHLTMEIMSYFKKYLQVIILPTLSNTP